jgi:hypothetical protein
MTSDEKADRRTRVYGNEGFQLRLESEARMPVGVAIGDSWFDYLPARFFGDGDVLDCLVANHGVNIYRTASAGDPMENMAWGTDYWGSSWNPRTEHQLTDALRAIGRYQPNFFLISGGGDDIVGTHLEDYLDHAAVAGASVPLRRAFDYEVGTYLRDAYNHVIASVRKAEPSLPIFFHGYDYPVADGRGVFNGPFDFHYAGPWLRPAFAIKRTDTGMRDTVLKLMIDTFNQMLASLHNPAKRIFHIDLRGELRKLYSPAPDGYQAAWANELHPTDQGFNAIANCFASNIQAVIGESVSRPRGE